MYSHHYYRLLMIGICSLNFLSLTSAQSNQNTGLGIQGNTYFSPVVSGKNFYGAYGSYNIRNSKNIFQMKIYFGTQFNKDAQILDAGATYKIFPTSKLVYIGVSPVSYRFVTLKSTLEDENPVSAAKLYGAGHLGLQIPIGKNLSIELESNYNYFYSQKAGGFGFALGFIFFNNDLATGAANYLNQRLRQ